MKKDKFTVIVPPKPISDQEIVDALIEGLDIARNEICDSIVIGMNMREGRIVVLQHICHETEPRDVIDMMKLLRSHLREALDDFKAEKYDDDVGE